MEGGLEPGSPMGEEIGQDVRWERRLDRCPMGEEIGQDVRWERRLDRCPMGEEIGQVSDGRGDWSPGWKKGSAIDHPLNPG